MKTVKIFATLLLALTLCCAAGIICQTCFDLLQQCQEECKSMVTEWTTNQPHRIHFPK